MDMPSSFSSRGPSTTLFRTRTMSSRGPEPSLTGQGGQLNGCSVAASAMDKVKLSPYGTAPSWKTVRPGLCIEGTCKTPTCQAYRHRVYCNAGFTSLDLMSSTACKLALKCPSCQHSIKPPTAGFWKCEWKFSGTKQGHRNAAPEAVDMEVWQQAGDDYERFKEDSEDETVWTKLVITTRALPSTEPSTKPSTEPSTKPSTEPSTNPSTEPSTSPKPESASKKRARQPSDSSDPNLVECSICCGDSLSRFGPTAINTPCGHCFHRACLKPWVLDQHKGCPTCRRDISCLVKELQK